MFAIAEITVWNVFYEYFMYKPSQPDENHEYYHLFNIKNNTLYLIEDNLKDSNSSSKEIWLFNLKDDLKPEDSPKIIKPNEEDISVIKTENMRIHGLYLNRFAYFDGQCLLVAIETLDGQIDFNHLSILKKPGKDFNYQFKQLRQIFPRNTKFDPIVRFYPIWQGIGYNFCVTKRQSNNFDLYFNAQKFYSSDDDHLTVQDIDVTFDTIFLKLTNNEFRSIDLKHQDRIGMENAWPEFKINFNKLFHQRIKNNCKIYSGFCLVRTFMLVTHSQILSQYRILNNQWINHIEFEQEIETVFRLTDSKYEHLYVVLKNGAIKLLRTFIIQEDTLFIDNPTKQPEGTEMCVIERDFEIKLKGENIVKISIDKKTNKYTMFITKNNDNQVFIEILFEKNLYEVQIPNFNDQHQISFIFSSKDQSEFFIQQDKDVLIYQISIKDQLPQLQQMQSFKQLPIIGKLHQGLKTVNGNNLILADRTHLYNINCLSNETIVYNEQNCQGLYFIDENYCYTLSQKSQKFEKGGLRLYEVQSMVEKNQDLSFLLCNSLVGCQSNIDFCFANQKLVFLSSFDTIDVIPLLHRNTISFIGMQERNTYLATKVMKDRFIALNNNNVLTTWDILTGKLKKEVDIKRQQGLNYSNYEIFQFKDYDKVNRNNWYNKILLKSKTPLTGIDEDKFFDPLKTQTHLDKQISFVRKQKKTFYQFKLVEIINEEEIIEHLSFIHPYFEGSIQLIYFSDNTEYMYEQLVIYRFFLYRKVPSSNGSNVVTWEHIHTFSQFPNDPLNYDPKKTCPLQLQFPIQFSPDFTQYVDIDRQKKTFMIKDSITQQVLHQIPDTLINIQDEDLIPVFNRFAWMDNQTIKVISHDGIERLYDVRENFKEISFNVIPMYDKDLCIKNNIIVDLPTNLTGETLQRLIRKYQIYKSTFYLYPSKDEKTMYEKIFTVDFGINLCNDRYIADLSFSFLHWKLIEQLKDRSITLEKISNSQIELLCYNILPGGLTVLHKLYQRPDIIEKIYQLSHPNPENKQKMKFHIPFLMSLHKTNLMSLVISNNDFRTVNILLKYLSAYEIDHHSRVIANCIASFIENDLPEITHYLDSRLLQTEIIHKKIKRGTLKNSKSYMVVAASYNINNQEVDSILNKEQSLFERDLRADYLDIPDLNTFKPKMSEALFDALSKTENMTIFEKTGIQMLIEYKWPLVRKFTINKLFLPFIVFQILYLIFMNEIYSSRFGIKNPQTNTLEKVDFMYFVNLIFEIILCTYSFYFILNEWNQFKKEKLEYLKSLWNYIDLVPQFLLIIFILMSTFGVFDNNQDKTLEGSLQATMSLLIWFKFLYFLRIFENTGYLIRIIFSVVQEMKFFLLILLLTITAFGDSMYQLSRSAAAPGDDGFIENGFIGSIAYVYRMILGDFQISDFHNQQSFTYLWILFVLCSVFNMIIMLNLLIAIISQVFIKVNSVSEQASYQEKACIIGENSYLIPQHYREEISKENKYLLLTYDTAQELQGKQDTLEQRVDDLKVTMKSMEKKLGKTISKKIKKHLQEH